jgi:hypothetical protein
MQPEANAHSFAMSADPDYSDVVKVVASAIDECEIAACLRIEGLIKRRVHTLGNKGDGSQIGQYRRESYKRFRKSKGRQIQYVDLQLEGDLIRGYVTGKTDDTGSNCVGFTNDFETEKAFKMERIYGQVFAPSEQEIDIAMKSYQALLDQKLKDGLR